MIKNAIQNFNIPVLDFERACQFYSRLLGNDLQKMEFHGVQLGVFPSDHANGGVGGALLCDNKAKPAKEGTIVFLNAGEDLQDCLDRMEGTTLVLIQPKTSLGPNMGFFALFDDSEGNRVGLYSKN